MAEQTGLQIAQEFCRERSLPIPATLTSSQDATTIQIWSLMNDGMRDMCSRYDLQALRFIQQFQHAGGGVSSPFMAFDINVNLPDFKRYYTRTLWDLTDRLELAGPLTPKEWQVLTTMLIASSRYQFTMAQNQFWIFPKPSPLSSITYSFIYQSRYGVFDPLLNGGAGGRIDTFTSDQAYPFVPRELIIADLLWRWEEKKGLPYAEDQRKFEGMLLNYCAEEPAAQLIMDGPEYTPYAVGPLILIPAGNWPT